LASAIYNEVKSTINVPLQAKCVVPLMNIRDSLRVKIARSKAPRAKPIPPESEMLVGEVDWITQLRRMLIKPTEVDSIKAKAQSKFQRIRKRKEFKTDVSLFDSPRGKDKHWHERHRRSLLINPVNGWKQIFEPNAYQRKRRERYHHRSKSRDIPFGGWNSMAAKSSIRKGRVDPTVPWFMEPLGQLLSQLKGWMIGGLSKAVSPVKKVKKAAPRSSPSLHKNRPKRSEPKLSEGLLSNVEKLRRIQKFYTTADYCNTYMREVGESNNK